ncbi:energy transducer TonB [Allochromatium vinosum]|uniref:energy transducer TonB n=1 Tax=Allochromatium vinosum TaxID=1049 RepID=UPI001903C13D|nr:energy transducer TonB [Allochromatium vinosum]
MTALQRAIARHQHYPAGARRHGQTGVATLAFVIEADGRIGQIRLAQSSGHASLDQAALQALARLGRFDPIPKSIGRSRWSLRIPIRFDLK